MENFYSRLVAWLKILLPLAALAILSTVVFFASSTDERREIPFIAQDGGPETPSERIAAPNYVSVTEDGSAITFRARQITPEPGDTNRLTAQEIDGVIETADGREIRASAPEGRIDLTADIATLVGRVEVHTSDGIHVVADGLAARLDVTHAESAGSIEGTLPFGTIRADRITIDGQNARGNVVVFNGSVELVYEPRN